MLYIEETVEQLTKLGVCVSSTATNPDDVLSALRLFKHIQVGTTGRASWIDSPWFYSGTSYRVLLQWPYGGKCELSEVEVPQFLELWHLLEEGATRFGFSIHRFNLAFDRGLLVDRSVVLVIAAESLFWANSMYRTAESYVSASRSEIHRTPEL